MQDSQAGPNRLLVSGQDLPGPGPMRGRRGESRDWSQRTATGSATAGTPPARAALPSDRRPRQERARGGDSDSRPGSSGLGCTRSPMIYTST